MGFIYNVKNFFRYPGGKSRLVKQFAALIPDDRDYCEVFVGGGSVFIEKLKTLRCKKIWLNDLDLGIYAIWLKVVSSPEYLCDLLYQVQPSIECFDAAKQRLLAQNYDDLITAAVDKIIVQQMSFSGLGLKSGSPLGGYAQKSKYKIDCRWNPAAIGKNISAFAALRKTKNLYVKVTNKPFSEVITEATDYFVYADPPYYEKGNQLYHVGFSEQDHIDLRALLGERKDWLLSYDNHPYIRKLYSGFKYRELDNNYTIQTSRDKKELIIFP